MFKPNLKLKSPKTISRSGLIKKLDAEFSIYIRKRYAIHGKASCFTCDKIDDWNKLQCGHFQSRKHYATRWDETNCQVQCVGCNVYRYGEQYKFGIHLDQVHGMGTSESLLQKSRTESKLKNYEIQEMIEYYKQKNLDI
jgi:hypothetical protein